MSRVLCANCGHDLHSPSCLDHHTSAVQETPRYEPGEVLLTVPEGARDQEVWLRIYSDGGIDGWVNHQGDTILCNALGSPQLAPALRLVRQERTVTWKAARADG